MPYLRWQESISLLYMETDAFSTTLPMVAPMLFEKYVVNMNRLLCKKA